MNYRSCRSNGKKRLDFYKNYYYIRGIMDNLTYMMNLIDGYYVDDRGHRHYRVEGKNYDIRFHPSVLSWDCNCPAFIYGRGKHCKHIKEIQNGVK